RGREATGAADAERLRVRGAVGDMRRLPRAVCLEFRRTAPAAAPTHTRLPHAAIHEHVLAEAGGDREDAGADRGGDVAPATVVPPVHLLEAETIDDPSDRRRADAGHGPDAGPIGLGPRRDPVDVVDRQAGVGDGPETCLHGEGTGRTIVEA